jgi:uncharacterized membrane protein
MKKYLITGPDLDPARNHDLGVGAHRDHYGPVVAAPSEEYQPQALFGRQIPAWRAAHGGRRICHRVLASNIRGKRLLKLWEGVLGRIPVVKSIYTGVKQVSDTLFAPDGQAFSKALLVQYPRQGSWTIAFLTGQPGGDVANHLRGEYLSVYVPTTPNPTSGFFIMMPRADVVELDMSVDEALKYVISMGVAAPESPSERKK